MYRSVFYIAMSMVVLLSGCNTRTTVDTEKDESIQQVPDYVIGESLALAMFGNDSEGYFPEGGLVPTAEIAFRIAEIVLTEIYGKETIEDEKPFFVSLKNGIWIIEGYLDEEFLGGVAYMEIRKSNGEILKVTHGK